MSLEVFIEKRELTVCISGMDDSRDYVVFIMEGKRKIFFLQQHDEKRTTLN